MFIYSFIEIDITFANILHKDIYITQPNNHLYIKITENCCNL